MKKINYKNYMDATFAIWNCVGSLKGDDLMYLCGSKRRGYYYDGFKTGSIKEHLNTLLRGKWVLLYESKRSIYFINSSKTKIARISQHWSKEVNKSKGRSTDTCGKIRSCWWVINYNNKHAGSCKWKIATTEFKNFKEITEHIEYDKYDERNYLTYSVNGVSFGETTEAILKGGA